MIFHKKLDLFNSKTEFYHSHNLVLLVYPEYAHGVIINILLERFFQFFKRLKSFTVIHSVFNHPKMPFIFFRMTFFASSSKIQYFKRSSSVVRFGWHLGYIGSMLKKHPYLSIKPFIPCILKTCNHQLITAESAIPKYKQEVSTKNCPFLTVCITLSLNLSE